MANDYLIGLHQFISRELDLARAAATAARQSGETAACERQTGRAEALEAARLFLSERFDLAHHRYY